MSAARWLLALAVLVALSHLPAQLALLRDSLPLLRLWATPDAQQREQLGAIPYDLLRASDAALPRDATLLLVTSGEDVRHLEYSTFHRALYFLAPRAVWWLSPAPPDGTWEARWWLSAPLDPPSVCAVAQRQAATHLLLVGRAAQVAPLPCVTGAALLDTSEGALLPLAGQRAPLAAPAPLVVPTLWPLRLLAGVAALLLLGSLLLALLGFRAGWVETLSLAWALGSGMGSLGMAGLGGLGLRLPAQVALLALLALAGALWQGRRAGASPLPAATPSEGGRLGALLAGGLAGCLALQLALVALGALGRPLWVWDSWVTWGMKARLLFLEGGIAPALYAEPARLVTHPDYPLLVPLLQAWLFQWVGAADDRLAGTATLLAYAALLGVCYAAVRRWGGSRALALAVLVALGMGTPVAGLAGIVFADTPLALLATIATLFLVEWLARGEARALWIAALAGGLLPWCKREGLLLLGVLCVATLLLAEATGTRGRAWRGVGALLLAGLLLAGPWWGFVAWAKVANSGDFAPLGWATLAANAGRVPTIARLMAQQLASAQWNGLWGLAALGALLLGRRRATVQSGDLLLGVAAGYLLAIAAGYLFSAYEPYPQHIATSAFRLIAHVAPLPALWIARRALDMPGA